MLRKFRPVWGRPGQNFVSLFVRIRAFLLTNPALVAGWRSAIEGFEFPATLSRFSGYGDITARIADFSCGGRRSHTLRRKPDQ